MTQPVDNEQSRVGEQLADAPSPSGEAMLDVLFDPMGHDPITDKEMVAYVAFLNRIAPVLHRNPPGKGPDDDVF